MTAVSAHLLALPESLATRTNNAQIRSLAKTPAGRAVVQRFAAQVANLVETTHAHRCARIAASAQEWQPAFEAGVDAENELMAALRAEEKMPEHDGSAQGMRDARASQSGRLERLSRRLLDVARGPV